MDTQRSTPSPGIGGYVDHEYWRRAFRMRVDEFRRSQLEDSGSASTGNDAYDRLLKLGRIRVTSVDGAGSQLKVAHFADITLTLVRSHRGQSVIERSADEPGRARIVLVRRGRLSLEGGEYLINGQYVSVLLPGADDVTCTIEEDDSEFISCLVPAYVFGDISATVVPSPGAEHIDRVLTDPIFQFLLAAIHNPTGLIAGRTARQAIGEIVRALVHLVSVPEDVPESLFTRAQQTIQLHLDDPKLNGAAVAHLLGVSLKRLQAEYRAAGTTVQREIRSERTATLARMHRENPDVDLLLLGRSVGLMSKSTVYRALAEDAASGSGGPHPSSTVRED